MKKALIILALFGVVGLGSAQADISVNFTAGQSAPLQPGSDGSSASQILPGDFLVQLIWSSVNSYGLAGVGGGVGPGEYVLFSGNSPAPTWGGTDLDGSTDYSDAQVGGSDINAGFVYARVFEGTSVTLGTFYDHSAIYNTALWTEASTIPKPTADPLELFVGAPNAFAGTGELDGATVVALSLQVVPEPSVIAIMGLGLVSLGVRRRILA